MMNRNDLKRLFLVHGLLLCVVSLTATAAVIDPNEADHYVALKGGQLWTWGANGHGQLGLGHVDDTTTPMKVDGFTREVSSAEAGRFHTVALHNSDIYTWGDNTRGQLGLNDTSTPSSNIPRFIEVTEIDEDEGEEIDISFRQLSAGTFHTLALDSRRRVWAWGENGEGQCGNGGDIQAKPTLVTGLPRCNFIAAGASHSVAIDRNGSIWVWGGNQEGQLGDPNAGGSSPKRLELDFEAIGISAGADHTLALDTELAVWAWGNNERGQLGIGELSAPVEVPVKIDSEGIQIAGLEAGNQLTLVLAESGSVYGCGDNRRGQLVVPDTESLVSLQLLPGLESIASLQAGRGSATAVDSMGVGLIWADQSPGELPRTPTTIPDYPMSLQVSTSRGGRVVSVVDGSVLAQGFSRTTVVVPFRQEIALRAEPELVYTFSDWSGSAKENGQVGENATDSVLMNQDAAVRAEFAERDRIELTVETGVGGEVQLILVNGETTTVPADQNERVMVFEGLPIGIEATATDELDRYLFDRWTLSSNCSTCIEASASSSTRVTVNGPDTLQALFRPKTPNMAEPLNSIVIEALVALDPNRGSVETFEPNVLDMNDLGVLSAPKRDIVDLTGLEWAFDLTTLDLSNNPNLDLAPLLGHAKLEDLNLARTALRELDVLSTLPMLKRLNLTNNELTDVIGLIGATSIERLKIDHNPLVSFEAFSHLQSLEYLLVNDTNNAIDDIPDSWLENLKQLKIVDLRGNSGLRQSDANVSALHFGICLPNLGHVYVDP